MEIKLLCDYIATLWKTASELHSYLKVSYDGLLYLMGNWNIVFLLPKEKKGKDALRICHTDGLQTLTSSIT